MTALSRGLALVCCLALVVCGLTFVGTAAGAQPTASNATSTHVGATVTVTPLEEFDASTFSAGAFSVRNTGSEPLTTVTVDLTRAVFPDMVFDPEGTAGDDGQKGITLDTATGDGVTVQSIDYLAPENGVDGGDGYGVARLTLSGFDPGETIGFSADVDPTSIKGSGPIQRTLAGPVSGIELVGSTVTVVGTSGTSASGDLFGQGTASGASAVLRPSSPSAPTVDISGVTLSPVLDTHRGATVETAGHQVVVSGVDPGATVRLLHLEGELALDGVPGTGYEVSPYEANDLVAFAGPGAPGQSYQEYTATAGSDGRATFQVDLSQVDLDRQGGYNHFVAVSESGGVRSAVSRPVVLKYDTGDVNRAPVVEPIGDRVVPAGTRLSIPVSASDPDFDAVSLSVDGLPEFARFSGTGGSGTISVAPGAADTGTYDLTVTASDGEATDSETVVLRVTPAGESTVVYRVNAGGSAVPATDGGPDWADDSSDTSPFRNPGSLTTFWSDRIDERTARVPDSTPGAIYRTARYDPAGGQPMQWDFDVPRGTLTEVRLYFAEGFDGAKTSGSRLFDVSVDGQAVLESYDIVADAGYETGTMRSHTVVSDGSVDVRFDHEFQNPVVSGIEVVTYPGGEGDLAALPPTVEFGTVATETTGSVTVDLRNLGASGDRAITVEDVRVAGRDSGPFGATRVGPQRVGPGASTAVNVTYTPTERGTDRATLVVEHTGANSPLRVPLTGVGSQAAPVGFTPDGLDTDVEFPTTLDWGPDGRLYVAERYGRILALSVERTGTANYQVTDTEVLTQVQDITNHDDDGSVNPSIDTRQVTGLLAAGTPEKPVLYVTSSDPREGGKQAGVDTGLDTNSGTISRLTKTANGWEHVQLVRGLPRSEENHSPNGMALDREDNLLYVAIGGNTGQGAPSKQLAYLPEYAYAAAVITVDLDAVESMPTVDGAKYDLPTLQDTEEPFGGRDGLNQAKVTPDSPVQLFATGLRNPYDLVLTDEDRLYTVDNGGSGGWGDVPVDEGPAGVCTNAPNEGGPDRIDSMHYLPQGFYAGHPNPTRGNPDGAGVYSSAGELLLDFTASNTPYPFSMANPAECDFRDVSEDGSLATFGDSTNGMAYYTASNFGGALQGDLLAASFTTSGPVWRLSLNEDGTQVVRRDALLSNFGSLPLDVTAVGDDGKFPGTIWAVAYGGDSIVGFEPSDYGGASVPTCTAEDDASLDADGDGFSNADEFAAGTDPCSAGDRPADADGDGRPDVVDADDDDDGLPDTTDPFALDADNGQSTTLPVRLTMEPASYPGTLFGMGFTGVMTNGTDYLSLFEDRAVSAGGIAGVFTIQDAGAGTALGAANTQTYGFQFGVSPGGPFEANATVDSPFPAADAVKPDHSAGIYLGTGDQDNFVAVRVTEVDGRPGVELLREVDGETTTVETVTDDAVVGAKAVDVRLRADPATGAVLATYVVDGETKTVGRTAVPTAWFGGETAPAIGLLASGGDATATFPVTYADLQVVAADAPALPTTPTPTPGSGATTVLVGPDTDGTTSGDGPGFGVLGVALALVTLAALAVRRRV